MSAYAYRNRILARLVASFPLLFTTSGDVICLKFSEVWEMLWIFKVARWTHDRCLKINKSPTVSNDVGASFFEIWTANLTQSLTVGTLTNSWSFKLEILPKTWHWDVDISDLGFLFLCFYFLVKNIKTCWIYKNTVFANLEKCAETFVCCFLLIFKVVYRDHLTQLLPFTRDFLANGQRLVWGQVG